MSVLPIGIGAEEGGYQIERSLRFNSADSAYLNRTLGTSNRRTFTFSAWVKRSIFASTQCIFGNLNYSGGGSTNQQFFLGFTGSDQLDMFHYNNGTQNQVTSSAVYRDPSAWYHIVGAVDTTQATSSNRLKIYVNGSQITALATATYPAQNTDTFINANLSTGIGHQVGTGIGGSYFLSGYLTEVHFIDGSALDPTSFGEYNSETGVWQPKAYTGSYGTNGFYLDFADNSSTTALGYDAAGSNDWTPNNFSVTAGAGNDSLVDTPTPYGTDTGAGAEVRGNYATLNPLAKAANATLSNGNLDYTNNSSTPCACPATIAVNSGKWYWEVTTSGNGFEHGLGLAEANWPTGSYTSQNFARYVTFDGTKRIGTASRTSYDASGACTAGTVLGFAADLDNGTLVVYRNGTSKGTLHSWTPSGTYYVPHADYATTASGTEVYNFGQRPFAYTAPSGFASLCTQNLPEPTVVDGSTAFNAVLWTGNSTNNRQITGVGFAPELVMTKARSAAYTGSVQDIVRGTGADKQLHTSSTEAESTTGNNVYGYISSFNADGYTLTAGTDPSNPYAVNNESGVTYVAWNWKANGAGVSNTDGTITSTVSANTTAGFSIVTYTGNSTAGATIGHGLGVDPSMIIVKSRTYAATSWCVSHTGYPTTQTLYLDSTSAVLTRDRITARGSTTFTVGSHFEVNDTGDTYVAYCFAPVEGYSAFGSYTGNGSSTDGPYVHLGFRARWIMFKKTSGTSNWSILDTARDGYNVADNPLLPNSSAAESTSTSTSGAIADILSNGFKVRGNSGDINDSGATYIYAAFGDSFKFALGR